MGLQNSSKEKTKPKDGTVWTLPSHKGEAAPWNRSPFVEKIIPNPSFSFCTKMSKLPCLVGQRHFISKFKFCFVVLQLYIYPSSQWNDVSQVHHCKNKYQMRWFGLLEVIHFNPAQTRKFYGHKKRWLQTEPSWICNRQEIFRWELHSLLGLAVFSLS